VLDIFRDDAVIAGNRARAERWTALLAPLAAHPAVRHFRRCGMIVAFDLVSERPDFARWWFAQGLARELLLRPIGRTLYFMPPYTLADDEMTLLVERTLEILDQA
jgi:adenosylmethionine-8-amino-7-oxononanoate aminotransferase